MLGNRLYCIVYVDLTIPFLGRFDHAIKEKRQDFNI